MRVEIQTESETAPLRSPALGESRGDLLLVFDDMPHSIPGRDSTSSWSPELRGRGWSLLSQPRSAGWCGFPVRTVARDPWRLWRVGENYGQSSERDEDEFLIGLALGERAATDLNGHMLVFGWNESERQWHFWTDRFGTVHAYRASGPRPAVGTFFPSVAAAGSMRRLDWTGLAGFFAFGFFPGDRTYFDDVRILRPGSHYVFDAAGRTLAEERYWSWRHEPDRRRSYDETVEEFASTLHRVLDDQAASGRIAVPISGGLDSRTTVAALTRPGAPGAARLWSFSYGYGPNSIETRIGQEVARARSLPFEGRRVEPYLFDRLASVLSCVEGFQDVTQSRQATVSDLLARSADAVVAAHWGDVWLDEMGLEGREPPTDAEILENAYRKMAKRGRAWLLDRLAAPRLGAAPEPLLRQQVSEELAPLEGIPDPDFRVKAFKTEQWSFRWTLASIRMYQAGAFPRLPFYDTRMTDFFSTVPTAFVKGRRLQIDYLKRYARDLARIRWQAYDTNLYWYRYFDSLLLPVRALKKAMRTVVRSQPPQRNWEVQFLSETGRRGLEGSLLRPGARVHEFVSPDDIRSLIGRFFAAPLEEGRGYSVSMLLTFSSWLEAYA